MLQVLHQSMKDGTINHDYFTRETWESGLHNPDVESQWTHQPYDCHRPGARHWAELRRRGYPCNEAQNELADIEDPDGVSVRSIELGESPKIAAPPGATSTEPIVWPPSTELMPWMLSILTGLCLDDCKAILAPPRKDLAHVDPPRAIDKRGQWSLF